jgi:hypothetical protein
VASCVPDLKAAGETMADDTVRILQTLQPYLDKGRFKDVQFTEAIIESVGVGARDADGTGLCALRILCQPRWSSSTLCCGPKIMMFLKGALSMVLYH